MRGAVAFSLSGSERKDHGEKNEKQVETSATLLVTSATLLLSV